MNNQKRLITTAVAVLIYSCLSLVYFAALDPWCYTKNILNCGIILSIPIPYIILVGILIFFYSVFLKQNSRVVAYPIIAMALVLPLCYLLADLKVGMCLRNPFGGNRGIYGIYAAVYFFFFLCLFSLLCGLLFRKLFRQELSVALVCDNLKAHNLIFHLPVLVYFAYTVAFLFLNNLIIYALWALVLFFLALLLEAPSRLLPSTKELLKRFVKNETFFLTTLFIIAFLIRYLWGLRLLGLTGENFPMASDDGITYNGFAATFAGGGTIPNNTMSGFAYWYFLGAIYKIFGLHNFKAVFAIQSLIGASVPLVLYLIGKKVFKGYLAPLLASVVVAFDMTLIFLSVVIGMEAIYIPLTVLALALAVYLLSATAFDYKKAFIIGCAFGLAYLARPPLLLLFPLVLAGIVYAKTKKNLRVKDITLIIAFLFLGFMLLVGVRYLTSYILYGEFPRLQGTAVSAFRVAHYTNENKILGDMGFRPFEDFKGTFSVFIQNPRVVSGLIIRGFFKRLFILYLYPNFGVFDFFYLVNPTSGYFFRFPVYVQFYACLLTLGGMFAAFIKKENLVGKIILLAFLAYISTVTSLFMVMNSRYRGVLIPVLALFFAYGLGLFYSKIKNAYGQKGF